MAQYSQFNLEQNRYAGQSTQQLKKSIWRWLEISLKWTIDVIGDMIRMVRGK